MPAHVYSSKTETLVTRISSGSPFDFASHRPWTNLSLAFCIGLHVDL